jgi:uncharacterized membrane protein
MNKRIRWLLAELDCWKAEGLVSAEQAELLRTRYASRADATSWGGIVFASAGAVVLGLGVILLLAYNWDDIPKFGKLALVFAAIIASHVAGLRWRRQSDWRQPLSAALSLQGTMFFGAGIWLVAQIYHIDEHYPTGFLIWALGAVALAWALDSVLQALLATVLLAIWGGCEVFSFRDPHVWALPVVALVITPLAWRRRSSVLLAVVLAAVNFLLLTNLSTLGSGAHMLTSAFAFGVFLIAVARLIEPTENAFEGSVGVLTFFGYLALIFCAYLLSFRSSWRYAIGWESAGQREQQVALLHSWILFGLAAAAWALLATRVLARKLRDFPGGEWLVPFALLYCYAVVWGRYPFLNSLGAHPFNLMLLGIASAWMWRGCRDSRLAPTVLGSLLLAAIVIARYFDLFQSLATRGLAFVILGGVFIAESIYYRSRRAQLTATKP